MARKNAASGGAKSSKELEGASNSLRAARAYLTKKKGKDFTDVRVALDEDAIKESLPHISSGSVVVDYLIGGALNTFGIAPCPGIPRGRVTQVWGHESAGKTTLALEACAAICAEGGTALYIDWENDIVPDYAYALGVPITDPNKFELLQPETLEDGIKYAAAYAAAGVDLIVFDSVGAAIPRRLAERDALEVAEQGKIGELQSVWSQELPNLKRVIAKTGTAIIGISQIRATMTTGPGKKSKPQGGNAWKFYSSVRLELRRVQSEKAKEFNELTHKTEETVVGGIIKVTAVKCKMSKSQGREEIFYIRWGEGIDNHRTLLEIAIAHGIVKRGGSWLTWDDCPGAPLKMQGVERLRSHLVGNDSHFQALRERVMPLLGQGAADLYVDETDDEPEDDVVSDLDAILSDAGFGDEKKEAAPPPEEDND
jgi:recombination protein RecA